MQTILATRQIMRGDIMIFS